MHVIYIVSQFPSLTETFVAREIEQLVLLGHQVEVCALRPTPGKTGLSPKGIRITYIAPNPLLLAWGQLRLLCCEPSFFFSSWRDLLTVTRYPSQLAHLAYIFMVVTLLGMKFHSTKIDHICCHFLHSEAVGSFWLSHILGVPYHVTAHVISVRFPIAFIRKIVQGAVFAVADTNQAFELLKTLRMDNIFLIHNGVDLSQATFSTRILSQPPIILAVGTLIEPKGFDILISACKLLKERGVSFQCRIIGEGVERPRLEQLAQELSVQDIVEMPGAFSFNKLREAYQSATIFVMASKNSVMGSDGLPTVLIEALAYGIPVVATRKAGIPDLIEHSETGLLAEPGDALSLAENLERLLCTPDLQQYVVSQGRKRVEADYDIRKSAQLLCQLIEGAAVHG